MAHHHKQEAMTLSALTKQQSLQRPSIEYYAFRHIPYAQFQALQLIYALFNQLTSLPGCSDDINVVRHKTQFWMQEIHAAYAGTPHHPITQDLQTILKTFPLAQEDWVSMMTAVDMDCDQLLLENEQEIQVYADKLYGSLYRLIARVLSKEEASPHVQDLALARTLLMFMQQPQRQGVRVNLSENIQTQVYTLFDEAGKQAIKPLGLLARLYKHQAREAMVHLGPLKTLWLSIRERLYSSS